MKRSIILLVIPLLLALLPAAPVAAVAQPVRLPPAPQAGQLALQAAAGVVSLTGTLTVIVGDRMPVAGLVPEPIPPVFTLWLDDGRELTLLPGAAGEAALLRLAGQRVSVSVGAAEVESALAADDTAAPSVAVASVALASGAAAAAAVSGNTRWITLACRFPDMPAVNPAYTIEYFQEMYRNSKPGLDHYWREVSNNTINVANSTARGWYTLPRPYAAYFHANGAFLLSDAFADCTQAAEVDVYFPDYYGINVVLGNDDLDVAYGGSMETTLDGVRRVYPTTWIPEWGLGWVSEFEHEMGHAYGLFFHSYSGLGAYGSPWDVESQDEYNCEQFNDPVYGCYGQHTIGRNKNFLGWLPPARVYTAGPGAHTLTLERSAQPGPNGYLLAIVPINGSTTDYYTVEARLPVGYDEKIPGPAVIVHKIDEDSHYYRRFELVSVGGVGNPEQGFGDGPNVMWLPGETFAAPEGGIAVHVDAATATGYVVTIYNGLESRTAVLPPTADTYVQRSAPNSNHGGEAELVAEPKDGSGWVNTRAALRFSAAAIPASAYRLRLQLAVIDDGGTAAPGGVHALNPFFGQTSTPWTEMGLTWNNKGDSAPLWSAATRAGAWLEQDITFGYGNFGAEGISSLSVDGQGAAGLVRFSSKEGANPPQLIVDYWALPAEPETHTFTPTDDATVSQAKPRLIAGRKPTLQVKDAAKDFNAYVKFNVTGLTGAVQNATLRLWVTNGGPDGGRVYSSSPFYPTTTTQWLETGLKWSNAPAIGGAALDAAGAVVAGQWIELDVTTAIVAATANGDGRVSFALTNDSTNVVNYSSKEGAHAPELVITTNDERRTTN